MHDPRLGYRDAVCTHCSFPENPSAFPDNSFAALQRLYSLTPQSGLLVGRSTICMSSLVSIKIRVAIPPWLVFLLTSPADMIRSRDKPACDAYHPVAFFLLLMGP